MALSTGFKKTKTAVFISGRGSNLKSLIKFSKTKKSPITINLIISNYNKSKGLELAKNLELKKYLSFKKRSISEKEILSELKKKILN